MRLFVTVVLVLVVAGAAAIGAAWWIGPIGAQRGTGLAFDAGDLGPLTAEQAAREAFRLAPALLLTVYDSFSETDDEAIYDRMAEAAAGDALETLYLERRAAMVGGGLDQSDQVIHELQLLTLETRRVGDTLNMDAVWRVLGTVGHAEHKHVRGNAYSADLVIEPVDGAWKITDFHLRDVDRTAAGTMVEADS